MTDVNGASEAGMADNHLVLVAVGLIVGRRSSEWLSLERFVLLC